MSLFEPFAVALGANLGDRRETLRWAVGKLVQLRSVQPLRVSGLYRTQPVQAESDREYLNAVFLGQTDSPPEELLATCLALEKEVGRERDEERSGPPYADRRLDLDLLFFGRRNIQSERLTIPHPEMEKRGFVLVPLAQVCPNWTHPVHGASIETLLSRIPDEPWVRLEEEEWTE